MASTQEYFALDVRWARGKEAGAFFYPAYLRLPETNSLVKQHKDLNHFVKIGHFSIG
jgi:hypothetical protein